MIVNHKIAKSIITTSKLPDADFVINPYIGCNHHCVYCYAEFMSRFTGHSGEAWGSFIDVKEGYSLPNLKKYKGKSILLGSATDPYNPLEKKYEKTRSLLKAFAGSTAKIEILTKSNLVLRDIDLLRGIPDLRIGISLSTTNADFARLTEAAAPSPEQRISALRTLHEAGIKTYAFISPIFPYLSDWKAVVSRAWKYTDMVCFENLNLRGAYKKRVLDLVRDYYPKHYAKFAEVYRSREAFRTYWKVQAELIEQFMQGKPHKLYFFHEDIRKK
jgi:DNA repair photolyase